jgi:hypothetical protein
MIETLEGRRLLSASAHAALAQAAISGHTIEFSQAPAAVQTGLDALATKDGVTAPTSSQTVFLSNINGVERYSVDIVGTGTDTVLTVKQNGNPVTAPAKTTTTFGTLSGTDAAATSEISAIATALSLTAPVSTTPVHVLTASDGTITYTVRLSGASATSRRGASISVDAAGNPVGNANLPFTVIPAAIQIALNKNAPAGATALATTSTQTVNVRTNNGVLTYSTAFTVSGTTTTVTVNSADALATLPTTTSTTFSAIPAMAQAELQKLATADGFSGTIAATQAVSAYDETNGTTIYTITVPTSQTDNSGATISVNITLSVDQSGNPTVLPVDAGGSGSGCDGGSDGSSDPSGNSNSNGGGLSGRFGRFGFRR